MSRGFRRALLVTAIAAPAPLAAGIASGADRAVAAPTAASTSYSCTGAPTTLFDDTNTKAVSNWGSTPTFSTKGVPYCLSQIITYHWDGGKGAAPGSIALLAPNGTTLGPFKAMGSSGQGGAPNVNWTAKVPTSPKPVVIEGTYACVDSSPATWSQDAMSGGRGFCKVIVKKALASGGGVLRCTGP